MMRLSTNKITKKLKNSSRIRRFTRRETIQLKSQICLYKFNLKLKMLFIGTNKFIYESIFSSPSTQ
jgi:hypothetical protein